MKLSVISFISLICTLNLSAQWGDNYIKLSKNITTESKAITGFDKIDVSEDFEVYIKMSEDDEKVEIEANENLHELIKVEKKGSTLKIYTKSYSMNSLFGKHKGAKEKLVAYITARKITEIKADEDVVITLDDKLYAKDLSIDLAEDCILRGEIEAQTMDVNLDEDSILDIAGSAETMRADVNEDSRIEGEEFTVGNLDLRLSEDSTAKLTVNGSIDLRAVEDSYFYHRGSGEFSSKILREDSAVKSW